MIRFDNVSFGYSKKKMTLHNINLKINEGEFVYVLGASGAGKTSLFKLILHEVSPLEGELEVNGYRLDKIRRWRVPKFRRSLGIVFQDFRLIPTMTVYDNIAFSLRVTNAKRRYIRSRVPYVLELMKISDKANAYPDELSGGEQQRVAIARALANDPKLLIADEPTGNVDPELSYEIVELLREINKLGTTVLMITHEHDLVRYFGGRTIVVEDGVIKHDLMISGEINKENVQEGEEDR